MKKLFIIIALFVSAPVFSQNQGIIDSLQILLKTAKEDTNRVIYSNKLCWEYTNISHYDTAMHYANSALQLAQRLNYKKGIAYSYHNIGSIYDLQGNYSEALKNNFASLKIRESIMDKQGVVNSYNNIGYIYNLLANYPEALKNHFYALQIREELKDKQGIAMSYNNIGNVYIKQNNYPDALKNYKAALKVFKETKYKQGIAASYNNIGTIYSHQGNYPAALKNYTNALQVGKDINDKQGISTSYNNIGTIYSHQGNYPTALKNHFASLKIKEEIGDKLGITYSFYNLGRVQTKLKKYKEAQGYFNKAVKLSMKIGSKESIANSYSGLATLDSTQGKWKEAYQHYKLFTVYQDSMFNETKSKQVTEMQTKYETAEKEKQIELLTNEKKLKETELSLRNSIIVGIVLISLLLFVLYNRYHVKQQLTADKQKLIIEKQLIEIEQKLLRLQMNPHFIFNALTAVQGFINTDRKNEAGIYLSKISRLIRSVLENSREEYISLEKEIQSLENYLNINILLMDYQFKYRIEVDDSIDKEQTFIPPMLAQPFIENALRHGIQDKENGLIIIRFKMDKQALLFEVEDNGIGLTKPETANGEKHQSLATIITKERLANLFRIPFDKISISINEVKDSVGGITGTKTIFEIPVKYI